jgi:alkylhydroperoxidase family enzyme
MDMTVEVQSSAHDVDVPVADESLIEDWLGLAGYLAEAIALQDVTVEAARAELAAAADGVIERQALGGAADAAAARFGGDALITTLLQWAAVQGARPAEAA